MDKEKAIKVIEQRYNSFINEPNTWAMLRGMAEYTKTIQELAETQPIIKNLEEQRRIAYKVYEDLERLSSTELQNTAKQVLEVAKQCKPMLDTVKDLQDTLAGRILSSHPLNHLNDSIFEVVKSINSSGYQNAIETIKKFQDNQKAISNIYGNYVFSPTYEVIHNKKKALEYQEDVQPWGAWSKMPIIKEAVLNPDELEEKLKKEVADNPQNSFVLLGMFQLKDEVINVKEGRIQNRAMLVNKEQLQDLGKRFQNFIIGELSKPEEKKPLAFNPDTSVLLFQGKEIIISPRAESDAHELLRTLFKDKKKNWSTDEILDDWEGEGLTGGRVKNNKVYQAGKAVNRKIAEATTITDFLKITTKNILINKDYLT